MRAWLQHALEEVSPVNAGIYLHRPVDMQVVGSFPRECGDIPFEFYEKEFKNKFPP